MYFSPYIDAAGLHIPTYSDILNELLGQFQQVFGQSVYLGIDSADYQDIAVRALKINDVVQAVQLAYNQRSPLTAIGSGLDSIVKLAGLSRKPASFSTCQLVVSGTPGTVINEGIAQDVNSSQWVLPSQVVISGGGSVTVLATNANPGNINANPGDILIIATPTAGWTSVTNTVPAVAGLPIEPDSQLRVRFLQSVALPSSTRLDGTIARIAAITGVTRYNILENSTGATDANGNPAHSITCVVEGGADLDIANTIYANKGIGPLTNGTTTVTVTDPTNGFQEGVSFTRPSYIAPYVSIAIHPLNGYTTATDAAIVNGLVNYLNGLQIGEALLFSELYAAALTARPNPDLPLFSIRSIYLGTSANPTGTSDLSLTYNQVISGVAANIVLTHV